MYFFDDFLFWRLPPLLHAMMVLEDTPGPHPVPLMPAEVTRVTRRAPADPRTTIPKWRPWPAGRLRVTPTSHHRPTQPATVSPGCVWRAGMARRPRDEPVRGSPRPPRVDFGHSCIQLGRRGYDSVHFFGALTTFSWSWTLIFGHKAGCTAPERTVEGFFVSRS